LRYDAGFWNEWYVLFDDGSNGWLSDASGQYVFTLPEGTAAAAPRFEEIIPRYRYSYKGGDFIASDVRTAQCIAGQGELPFQVGKGWQAKAADFRCANRFLTLDYSESDEPRLYLGKSVSLEALHCQLLRSDDDIAGTAGRFKGKTTALDCPSCGGAIQYQAGMAFHVVCPSCHSEVDCSTDKALVLQKHEELARVQTTLALGDTGTINLVKYSVIGLMKRRELDPEESSEWIEYLLFNSNKGFLWLVESDGAWDKVEVLNEWPESLNGDTLFFQRQANKKYQKLYEYNAEVVYAAGAFNWRISIGDKTRITDFGARGEKLTAEATDNEITWSASKKVPADQVGNWFGKTLAPSRGDSEEGQSLTSKAAKVYSILLAALNVPIAFVSGGRGLLIVIVGLLLIWAPVFLHRRISGAE
jgi:hypothetical protein